jgi:hypothetical protein
MTVYQNPVNGYKESVTCWSILWAFLFGPFYFCFKGAWGWAALSVIAAIVTAGVSLFVFPFAAPSILETMYMKQGYKRV